MHFLFCKIMPEDADYHTVLSYMIQEAHPIIARFGNNQLATLLPSWQLESPGRTIAFSGEKPTLEKILKQEYFQEMIDQEVLQTTITKISTEDYPRVRFIKNQKITHNTPKAIQRKIRRSIRRQIERGEIQSAQEYRPRTDQSQGDMPNTFYHLLYHDSSSTLQNMPLCIQLVPVEENEEPPTQQTFDHYGFSTLSEHRATVPLITPFF